MKLLNVSTFHSLGMRMLREEANEVGLKKKFSIFDAGDSGKILHEIIGSSGKDVLFRCAAAHFAVEKCLIKPRAGIGCG